MKLSPSRFGILPDNFAQMLKDGVFREGKRLKFALALCGATLLCQAAAAAPTSLALSPANAKLSLTVYALGLFPLPGDYQRFSGTLAIDPAHPDFCHVRLSVDQSSLTMSDPARARRALAPDMLDAARFPTMDFDGACHAGAIAGTLTLHGITRPLSLALRRAGTMATGEGRLLRHDYGIDGMPHLLGQDIRIHFSTTLPMP
jgi:polyisoprenoid-binding protein YceI